MVDAKLYCKYYDMAGIEVKDKYSLNTYYDLYYWCNIRGMKQIDLTLRYNGDTYRYKHLCCVSIDNLRRDIKIDTTEDGGWGKFMIVNNITELYIRVKNVLKSLPESVRNEYIRVLDMYIKEWSEGK